MTNSNILRRPQETGKTVPEGSHRGNIEAAITRVVDSRYSETGKREVLELKVGLKLPNGETATLTHQVTLTWSTKGHMLPLLQNLDALPAPGENLNLSDLIGLPVSVIVENVKKADRVFSNIVSMKRAETEQIGDTTIVKEEPYTVEDIDDLLDI